MESILFSRNGKLPRPIFKKRGDPTGIDEVWQNADVNVSWDWFTAIVGWMN